MVVKILSHSAKQNTKKAMKWFEQHDVPYELYNLNERKLTYEVFLHLLHHCIPGKLEFLSTKSVHGIQLAKNLDNLTIDELFRVIVANPKVLTEPIMFDEMRVLFKYQEIEMTQFLSRAQKKKQVEVIWHEIENR